jgi:hypothetical protein
MFTTTVIQGYRGFDKRPQAVLKSAGLLREMLANPVRIASRNCGTVVRREEENKATHSSERLHAC